MKKYIKDGSVAILYAPNYGIGWYNNHGIEELIYDADLVQLVLNGANADDVLQYCQEYYDIDDMYFPAIQLRVSWVPIGAKFRIHEYDGAETVMLETDYHWMIA